MAWFDRNRYDTGFGADRHDWRTGYGRLNWDREREWPGGPSHRYWDTRDYGADYTDRGRTMGAGWYGGASYGRGVRAGYGVEYREPLPPRQSPAYGRAGDREVRGWAQRHGYDASYEIQPRSGGGAWGNQQPYGRSSGWSAGERSDRSNADYWADYGRRRARFDRW